MISVREAQDLLARHLPRWGSCEAHLGGVGDHLLEETLVADRDYPPFPRVMMDGIAVSWPAFESGRREFRNLGVAPAGEPVKTLSDPLGCLEVMTGAPLPAGTDLVVPYEHLTLEAGEARITTEVAREKFENVHLQGSDCRAGAVVLEAGQRLNGPHWGIAASVGRASVKVARRPRVLIVSTGDELVEVEATPLAHQIRRSNAHALRASLLLHGYGEVALAHLRDDPRAIAAHYEEVSPKHELLIYSGGVSRGKFDYLPQVWQELGVTKVFHGVAQRPGKPLWFGVDARRKTAVLGLPGNPVSSLVCLHRYLLAPRRIHAVLGEDVTFKKALTYFLPVRIEFTEAGSLLAWPVGMKNSGEFTALAGSDGFVELPGEKDQFEQGEAYPFYPWRPVL